MSKYQVQMLHQVTLIHIDIKLCILTLCLLVMVMAIIASRLLK